MKLLTLVVGLILGSVHPLTVFTGPDTTNAVVVLDDFESDDAGQLPKKWRYLSSSDRRFLPLRQVMSPKEKFFIVSDGDNNFLRAYTEGEAQRISLPAGSVEWELSAYPRFRWEWRARQLPEGAREDKVNDSGGAVYVSFSKTDWLGRPLSIKYVYSSTLPVGTTVSTGPVKIIVVSSGANGTGRWVRVERNVVEDYRAVFGGDPPNEPFTITLWSDSDNTKSIGEVDFDNLVLMRGK